VDKFIENLKKNYDYPWIRRPKLQLKAAFSLNLTPFKTTPTQNECHLDYLA
jgi:hypothetical protein